jgi:hypothetical protein
MGRSAQPSTDQAYSSSCSRPVASYFVKSTAGSIATRTGFLASSSDRQRLRIQPEGETQPFLRSRRAWRESDECGYSRPDRFDRLRARRNFYDVDAPRSLPAFDDRRNYGEPRSIRARRLTSQSLVRSIRAPAASAVRGREVDRPRARAIEQRQSVQALTRRRERSRPGSDPVRCPAERYVPAAPQSKDFPRGGGRSEWLAWRRLTG